LICSSRGVGMLQLTSRTEKRKIRRMRIDDSKKFYDRVNRIPDSIGNANPFKKATPILPLV
jgi:hypothetical protein